MWEGLNAYLPTMPFDSPSTGVDMTMPSAGGASASAGSGYTADYGGSGKSDSSWFGGLGGGGFDPSQVWQGMF